MITRRQLEQVQRNRTRPSRVRGAGVSIRRLVDGLLETDLPVAGALAGALAEVVDAEFKAHGCIGDVRAHTVTIHVDHPALVYSFRMRWLGPVAEALRRVPGCPTISKVFFKFGRGGVGIPAPLPVRRT